MAVTTGARCFDCPTPIQRGERIVRMGVGVFRHLECPTRPGGFRGPLLPRSLNEVDRDLDCTEHGHVFGLITGAVRHCVRFGCNWRDALDPDEFLTADDGFYDFDDPQRDQLGYDGDDAYVLKRGE